MYKAKTIQQLKALGEVHRLKVLEILNQGSERLTASQLLSQIPNLSQPSLSRHLKVLREANLISEKREGREVWYGSVPNPLVSALLGESKHMSKETSKAEKPLSEPSSETRDLPDSSFQEWLE